MMFLQQAYLLLCMGWLMLILESSSPLVTKPRIVLHIGPHKTGSSHIQTVLSKYKTKLASNNYCFPAANNEIKEIRSLAHIFMASLSSGQPQSDKELQPEVNSGSIPQHIPGQLLSHTSLQDCLKHEPRPNLILSSEEFDRWNEEALQLFVRTMSVNYGYDESIDVVIVYRDWLTHLYSMYTQLTKTKMDIVSFQDYVFSMQDIEHHVVKDIYGLIERFGRGLSGIVGKKVEANHMKHIHIIDYQGSLSDNVDIAKVMLCEIMHVLCEDLLQTSTFENKKPADMIVHELASHFHYFVRGLGCRLCGNETRGYTNWTMSTHWSTPSSNTVSLKKLPSTTLNIDILRFYAKHYDDRIRNAFSDRMYHGNRDANLIAIDSFQIETIHRPSLVKNDRWVKRFMEEFEHRANHKMICNCDAMQLIKSFHSNRFH